MTKILVVEDNPMNFELARELLELEGHQVLLAETAAKGIRLAGVEKPSVILMDMALPDMDGLSATKAIRATPGLEKVPIVALSAHAMERDRELALEAGCNGYITKPINTRTFASEIAAFLPTAGSP